MATLRYLKVTSKNVLLPSGRTQPASITVDRTSGKIVSIDPEYVGEGAVRHAHADTQFLDVGHKHILPGLIDTHVHLNEPGHTDWEGFWTGTRAAVSGGITTVVDMPLDSSPPTITVENLEIKRMAAQGQCWTDVAFWGGAVPGNQKDLKPLIVSGVKGFKCFLIDSGNEEFPPISESDLREHMQELEHEPTVLLFHAELEDPFNSTDPLPSVDSTLYDTFLSSRPEALEVDAVTLITRLQEQYPSLRCHIAHLSASSALDTIRAARKKGYKLTVETCFHYLCLSANNIPSRRPEFKCCPPIRDQSNRDRLWKALIDGDIDCVVSDHSPCAIELKMIEEGDIMAAWAGISSLGLGLSLLWTEGSKPGREVSLGQVVQWMGGRTAELAGLSASKGSLVVGLDGDLVIWDADAEYKVSAEDLYFKNRLSAYEGLTLKGVVQQTFLRGHLVFDRSQNGFDGLVPIGKLL